MATIRVSGLGQVAGDGPVRQRAPGALSRQFPYSKGAEKQSAGRRKKNGKIQSSGGKRQGGAEKMTMREIEAVRAEIIPKFAAALTGGLCGELGEREGRMSIMAAVSKALDLPHGEQPDCVSHAVRWYTMALGCSPRWVSAQSRAAGLRNLGIAGIGSRGISDGLFSEQITKRTIQILIPKLFREVFFDNAECLEAADRCEQAPTAKAAVRAALATQEEVARLSRDHNLSWGHAGAIAAEKAALAAANGACVDAINYAILAVSATKFSKTGDESSFAKNDDYLLLGVSLAIDTLKELKSPGCEWLAR